MINITYNDLITLINSSSLVVEEQYRIIDYVTTVSKANYSSAGYKFDIVVTALTTNTLYEYATLMPNSTETYFDANALLLYNIKYNVNNQIPGYYNDWVDTNGKGCIYYMVDDKGNEAPFDFKNIKYYGNFLFHSSIDGSDTSQTVSTYNSIKEAIEDGIFTIPQISFVDACSGCTIGTNAGQLMITECSNLQIGDNCILSNFINVNDTLIGNELSGATLTSIEACKIGNNNINISLSGQTNLIISEYNNNITIDTGGNGVIIDSNNINVTIGTNAKDVYINASKTINLGNNTEQFNISSSYDVVVADDCKLFTLTETNHLTSTSGCQSINTISNNYITLTESVTNITISEGLTNLILDGNKLVGNDVKTIIQEDEKVVVINEQTNNEVVLTEDGTTTVLSNSYVNTNINITYTELKNLRDNGQLVPGQKYRITDYITTTTQTDTKSDGNVFDIIVESLDKNNLSENASVTKHDSDTYFSDYNANLDAWELKYCLDNDTSRFAWADSVNGKGVIYYMKDENGNECPYDFKNIQFYKNLQWIYTFNNGNGDGSITNYAKNNNIKIYILNNKQTLNANTFYGNCNSNIFDNNCYNNDFWGNCDSNIFGNNCYNNYFFGDCDSNIFGNSCHNNYFLGDDCSSNVFGNNCSTNYFDGYGCFSNTFGNNCSTNSFSELCSLNTFGNNCSSNTFGNNCSSNTFGNSCSNNKFYNGNSGTTPKNFIRYLKLNNNIGYNIFYSEITTNSTNFLQRINISGLVGTSSVPLITQITLTETNTNYEWVIAKNSSGVIQQYCPENLTVDTGITDAPIDGTPYSRQDGGWVVAETGIEEALSDGKTYGRKNGAWSEIVTSGGGGTSTVSITWSSLKALRDDGTLVPGQSYRITDYVCTTVTTNTRSANKQFDIIVTALYEDMLSEKASAMYHDSDTYFTNTRLESWELKYCLDNDTNRFDWADSVNGKGVIYYMKDEHKNEVPYDFKNIQYLKSSVWIYTFGGTVDDSLIGGCSNNIINLYISSNKQTLNNITFGNNCKSNIFGYNCFSNTFGNECNSNTFDNECSSNTFGDYCGSNHFGNDCDGNNFGDRCYSNNFGDSCWQNTFGDWCYSNKFGDRCYLNNFYHGSSGTTKKNYMRFIILEDNIRYNNFYSNVTTSSSAYLQRIRIKGLEYGTPTNLIITLPSASTDYEWVIAKNSSGVIKQYCPENLVP